MKKIIMSLFVFAFIFSLYAIESNLPAKNFYFVTDRGSFNSEFEQSVKEGTPFNCDLKEGSYLVINSDETYLSNPTFENDSYEFDYWEIEYWWNFQDYCDYEFLRDEPGMDTYKIKFSKDKISYSDLKEFSLFFPYNIYGHDKFVFSAVWKEKVNFDVKNEELISYPLEYEIYDNADFYFKEIEKYLDFEHDDFVKLAMILNSYNKNQLRLLRNAIYAKHGYVFKSTDLNDFFSESNQYEKNTSITNQNIYFKSKEKWLINVIKTFEEDNNLGIKANALDYYYVCPKDV